MKDGSLRSDAPQGKCTGTPEEVAAHPESYTGQYLKKYLEQ